MRVIRPALTTVDRWRASVTALLMLLVGSVALLQMALLPPDRPGAVALLGISAALGIGVGLGLLGRALAIGRRRPADPADDLVRLLRPIFDESYTLVLAPRLPGVPRDLAALLVGPAGVRAIVVRRWRGRYRLRGRAWDYDTRTSVGWIGCRTNPSYDLDAITDAVLGWARMAIDDHGLPISGAVAFPRSFSQVVLEEPATGVITADNAPWWAHRVGRVQRLDAARAERFLLAVEDAAERALAGALETATPESARSLD